MRVSLVFLATVILTAAAERPNILWITSEDNAAHWLGCYGNKDAETPHLDGLAKEGTRFKSAFSNAPVCAVARATILMGAYSPTMGTQHMRSRHAIPDRFQPYVTYLREAGYYCTNRSKTDYNFRGNDQSLWDECSGKADYANRGDGQPFFAIVNLTSSHESSLFENTIRARRKSGQIPASPRLDPTALEMPPFLPDLPEIRSDIAIYHDMMTMMDREVGEILAKLEKRGLADDTIVFYYADHGGITPRGKRYLEDTGVRVPLLVRVPGKWKSLSPFAVGEVVDEPVSFVDLAPTLLSLLGMEPPVSMQGRAFLGEKRREPADDEMEFLYADRFDEIYGMRRGLTDGRWKYIRRFTPHLPDAPYSNYQFGQAGWRAWQKAWREGKLEAKFARIWEPDQEVELLFDTGSDPWEIKNLAGDQSHRERLESMRRRLVRTMTEVADSGIVPEPMFAGLAGEKPVSNYVKSRSKDWPGLVELAFQASAREKDNLPRFIKGLASSDPLERYWSAQGCLILGKAASEAAEKLEVLLEDSFSPIRVSAAESLVKLGQEEKGLAALVGELDRGNNAYAQQNVINVLTRLDSLDRISDEWVKETLAKSKGRKAGNEEYLLRLANGLAKARGLGTAP